VFDGVMGTNGSLDFIFERKGVFTLNPKNVSMNIEELEMELIDGGLEELEADEEAITVYCEYADFKNMQTKLEELDIEIKNSELQRIPNNFKTITEKQAEKVLKLLNLLDEDDDVQQVFHNMKLTEEILNTYG
jgi:transcriptional/translational regulatory protein YebC/TACO1